MTITRFEVGKYYRLTKRPTEAEYRRWNPDGEMDFMLDMKPHLCTQIHRHSDSKFCCYFDNQSTYWDWESVRAKLIETTKEGVKMETKNNEMSEITCADCEEQLTQEEAELKYKNDNNKIS